MVQDVDGAALGVEAAAGEAVGAGLLVEEVDELLLGPAAGVGLALGRALGEELDGRVGSDALLAGSRLAVLGLRINLGDDDVGLGDEVLRESFPGRSQGLAVYGGRDGLACELHVTS